MCSELNLLLCVPVKRVREDALEGTGRERRRAAPQERVYSEYQLIKKKTGFEAQRDDERRVKIKRNKTEADKEKGKTCEIRE